MITDVILQLAPPPSQEGVALRYDCPFCDHKKTLSIKKHLIQIQKEEIDDPFGWIHPI